MDEIAQGEKQTEAQPVATVHGNGSVAHQIIGGFLIDLEKHEDCVDVAKRLEAVIFQAKPTEEALYVAIFGEDTM